MARVAVVALVLGVALAFAGGCGSSDDPEPSAPRGNLTDLEKTTVDKATKAQIERFAGVRIPASATNLRSSSRSAMDTQVLVSFSVPRADLSAFITSGKFRGTLTEGDRAIAASTGSALGWQLDQAKKVEGLADTSRPGLYRNVLVVLDDSERPAVYLEAGTL